MTKYTKTFADSLREVRELKVVSEFKKMVVDIKDQNKRNKAIDDLKKQKFKVDVYGGRIFVDGKGADLNKYATDLKNFYGAHISVRKESLKEDYEVSMAVGQLKTIQERVGKIMDFLSGKSDDYNMEAWLQSKITSAEDKLNSVANYVTNNPEVNEANLNVDNVDKGDSDKEKELKIKLDKEKDQDVLQAQIITLKGQLELVKQKLENEKNKVVKPEPNPETGEVPLRTGLANAILDKKINTKDLVQSKKKKEIKVGGKTKIEINPDVDIGNFSGGMRTNNGNLH
jgi:hypothetical protein